MSKKWLSLTTLWLVVFGLINLFASGRWTVAAAAWIAPVFALRYLHQQQGRRKYLRFFLVYWITLSIPWYGATPVFGPAHFIFMAVMTLTAIIPYLLDGWLAPRLRRDGRLPFIATLIFPLAGTTLEFLSNSANPIGNFGVLGYSQFGMPVLTQLVALTGMLGLTFLVSWFPAVVHWAWDNGFRWSRVRAGVAVYAVLLLAVIAYGLVRLQSAPAIGSQDTVKVGSFTLAEIHMGDLNTLLEEAGLDSYRETTQAVHRQYLAMTGQAIADGAQIILWPELAVTGVQQDVQAAVEQGRALAGEAGIYLAMPTFTVFPDSEQKSENVLFVAGPDGSIVLEHVKYGGNILEGTLKGSGEIQAIDTPYGRLAGIICWDTNYPSIVRQVGQQGADILLSPAKDWPGINPMHAEMAAYRAIENGTAVIRQADEGLSVVIDGYGRTLASGEGLADGGNYLLVDLPTSGPSTIYPQVGDAVGIASAIALVALAAYALVAGRRRRSQMAEAVAAVS